ncbi:hypothetical protein PTKIN_Ptkin09bG0163900 [Pterospermum kingtungense]
MEEEEEEEAKTVVWTANQDEPPFPSDGTLLLSPEGRLIVQQQKQGLETIIANSTFASSAAMLDSGNFVLFDSTLQVIWQTFDFPTDTILPGQRLLSGQRLVSDVSGTNHNMRKFQLIMQRDENLVQYPVDSIKKEFAYWSSRTLYPGDNVTLNLDTNGQLFLVNATTFVVRNITEKVSVSRHVIHRATMDADGIFRLYSHSSNQSGFDYINQDRQDLGCQKNYSTDFCITKSKQNFDVQELRSLSWEDDPYATIQPLSKDDCKDECSRDCNCEVAVYQSLRQVNELKMLVREDELDKEKLERVVKVGLWCTQDEPSSQPSMKKVILMLEGTVNIPDPLYPSSINVSSP